MARIKTVEDDFVVEELPAYEPSGTGDHLFVRFTKRGLTTDAAVARLAEALDVPVRACGVAGLKDKVAVTTQTVSFPWTEGLEARALAVVSPGITVHDARRHTNKLKTGHLRGNRFTVVVRDLTPAEQGAAATALTRIAREGLPNAFGSQRFGGAPGRGADAGPTNVERAIAFLTGRDRGPRDPRKRRFLFSALQSAVFNVVLARRVADGTWSTVLPGDVVKRRDSGGLFVSTDAEADAERAAKGEVTATGPMFGVKMRRAEGAVGELEEAVWRAIAGADLDLAKTRAYGEGTRRPLRLWIDDLRFEVEPAEQPGSMRVYFVLPKGAYATTVIAAAVPGVTAHEHDAPRGAEGGSEPLSDGGAPEAEESELS